MKNIKNKILITTGCLAASFAIYSCSKSFLERQPVGQINTLTLDNKAGVNGLLIGAYSMLDGEGINDWLINTSNTSVWNPWAGSVASDDAHKGGGYGNQGERGELENKSYTAQNVILGDRWKFAYAAVQRANEAIRGLNKVAAGQFTDAEALQVKAEARFLRGYFHLEAAKMWRNIPFVDETITFSAGNFKVSNQPAGYAWAKIEDDFKFAVDNLTEAKTEYGRANKWAAKALLAKTYMQENKLTAAMPILEDIIANGVNTKGIHFDLQPQYEELFRTNNENGPESVFAVQMSVNDGGEGRNGNEGLSFNLPSHAGSKSFGGWGHQPSFNLVNAFKTQNGLPMFGTFNDVDVKNNLNVADGDPFTPDAGTLDPRLDWTVTRRGLPIHDWGLDDNSPNISGGPYWGKKPIYWHSEEGGKGSETIDGWQTATGINFNIVRFADVLLMAAECQVENGSLQTAADYVNRVRARAANPAGFLYKYVNDADVTQGFSATPAANYDVQLYTGPNGFVAKGQPYAREAVRFERRLEFAMEGGRFFDLQRWDLASPGYMANVLNTYIPQEVAKFEAYLPGPPQLTYNILKGALFKQGIDEIYAIPQVQIDLSAETAGPTLIQNPGHN